MKRPSRNSLKVHVFQLLAGEAQGPFGVAALVVIIGVIVLAIALR